MSSRQFQTRDLSSHYDLDLFQLHQLAPARYPGFLESVAQGQNGRYDILFAFPGVNLILSSDYTSHYTNGASGNGGTFLEEFDQWFKAEQLLPDSGSLPFTGGWFIYLGYELVQQIEPRLSIPKSDPGLPVAVATRIAVAIVKDHFTRTMTLVMEDFNPLQYEQVLEDIENCSQVLPQNKFTYSNLVEDSDEEYLSGVNRIKQYIRDGDVFQVNLSRQWHAELDDNQDYISVYRSLRQHNPAPFAGLFKLDDMAVVSSSPERLVRKAQNRLETRPIAGTRPTSAINDHDQAYKAELIAHPKERAEHVMLLDLERNDLGRVCIPGSIKVDELMVLESYAHVHHIVSNIRGEVRNTVTPSDIIQAVFPGGTITGCPKVRCMEIIAELERRPRQAYTGSMGYINRNGSMDLNILIRTIVVHNKKISLMAGAGVVADSKAEKELLETRAKARGLLLAFGECDEL